LKAPDLLASDVTMSGISGIDLAIQMRAQYPKCKILLFSGQPATLGLADAAHGHEFDHLLKPVRPPEFVLELGRMVNVTIAIHAA
jgi:DNA-binding NtrC family response regulator